MAKRKITEPPLLLKGKRDTFQDKMDRLIGQSPFEERSELKSQLLDETFLRVIGKEKEKELQNRLNQLLNRDFFMSENKEYLAKRKDYLDKIKFKMEKDALDKHGETIQMLNERDKKQDGGELVGGQKELDKNNDGDITGEDFAMLREEREAKQVGGMMMDDQMADMMETEETPDMDNQMADMMPEEKTEEQKAIEKAQAPDEMMEENYVDFLIDEALSDDEEAMLMQELQANPQLSMLFDKVMEVAMEFSGSGPVEGPGTEVSDSIPARLSDGEFVFTAKSVDVLGADNLMSLMKQAEAQADGRQMAQDGGLMEEEDTAMPVQQEPVRQDIRVTKETVDSQAAMQDEEDLVGDEIKKSMLSGRPHVRS